MIEILQLQNDTNPETKPGTKIIMSPDRSLDWEGNKRVIWSLGGLCGGIAIGFTLIAGTWVMLPFAGIEILAFSSALYYVSWKLSYRHIVTIYPDSIVIEKGIYKPKGIWTWVKQDTRLLTEPPKHDWEAQSLTLENNGEEISIGDFLSPRDAEQAIDLFRQHILVTGKRS